MKDQEARGKSPGLPRPRFTKLESWKMRLLGGRSLGDATIETDGVVGSAQEAVSASAPANLPAPERRFLLELARRTLTSVVANGELPQIAPQDVTPGTTERKACFITLTKAGELRGCIGHVFPQESLYQAVMHNTRNAALKDSRFPPIQADEAAGINIEISVLTEPQPLAFTSTEDLLSKLRPGEHGVLLQVDGRLATFLPQVWEQMPDKVQLLERLSQKAGCLPSAWQAPGVSVSVYHAESFAEPSEPSSEADRGKKTGLDSQGVTEKPGEFSN